MRLLRSLNVLVVLIACSGGQSTAGAAPTTNRSLEKANMLYEHRLTDAAKNEYIDLLFDAKSNAATKATCLYWLGQIAFDEERQGTALKTWSELVEKHPTSPEAVEIRERLIQLREVVSQAVDDGVASAVALSYLRNGDFWSEAKQKFTIDSSWLPNVEMAVEWYDKVISDFPGTPAADLAFRRKMFTLIGWQDSGRYGEAHGIKANPGKYLPMLLSTFEKYEEAFPKSPHLPGFRYQIAQAYWSQKNWVKTREWLQRVAEQSNSESFYSRAARWRLERIEY